MRYYTESRPRTCPVSHGHCARHRSTIIMILEIRPPVHPCELFVCRFRIVFMSFGRIQLKTNEKQEEITWLADAFVRRFSPAKPVSSIDNLLCIVDNRRSGYKRAQTGLYIVRAQIMLKQITHSAREQ